MKKLTNWIITIIGVLLLLAAGDWGAGITAYNDWLIAIGVLVIGITRLSNK
jgi:hypothetical protein